eukprot:GILI01030510.1.p1 GENE.GILI01030510.1~~GILI01030510.1.p1  ORF type:complete len:297 (-),score=6.00 GILI01030510.1:64-954(-)
MFTEEPFAIVGQLIDSSLLSHERHVQLKSEHVECISESELHSKLADAMATLPPHSTGFIALIGKHGSDELLRRLVMTLDDRSQSTGLACEVRLMSTTANGSEVLEFASPVGQLSLLSNISHALIRYDQAITNILVASTLSPSCLPALFSTNRSIVIVQVPNDTFDVSHEVLKDLQDLKKSYPPNLIAKSAASSIEELKSWCTGLASSSIARTHVHKLIRQIAEQQSPVTVEGVSSFEIREREHAEALRRSQSEVDTLKEDNSKLKRTLQELLSSRQADFAIPPASNSSVKLAETGW